MSSVSERLSDLSYDLRRRASSADAGTWVKIIVAGGIAVGGIYFIYKLANPGAAGGSCTDPSTPCGAALAPLQQELQSCLDQFTQLNAQIAQSGVAPTPGQLAALASYTACMNSVGAQITTTASNFVTPSLAQNVFEAITVIGVTAAIAKFGLPGLGNAIANARRNGLITTSISEGGSAASVIENGTVLTAENSGLITADTATEWANAVGSVAQNSVTEVGAFYNELASEGYITEEVAAAAIDDLTASITADATAVSDFIESGALGYAPPVLAYSPPRRACGQCF